MYEKRELKNKLSWSKKRHEMFQNCNRMYFFNYYGSWGGWNYNTNHPIRELYVMKKLSSIPMWVGDVVHENIDWVLFRLFKWQKPASFEQVKSRLRKYMEYDWLVCQKGYYKSDPIGSFGLSEHFYNEPINENDFEEAYSHAEQSLKNFFDNSIYNQMLDTQSIEIIEDEELAYTRVKGIKVWVKCDVILQWGESFFIIDWKTGRKFERDGYDLQLAIYAMYLMKEISKSKEISISPSDIRVTLSNIYLGEEFTNPVEIEKIYWAEEEIVSSTNQMKALLRDPVENIAAEEDFPKTKDVSLCKTCNFRKACEFPI